VEINEEKIDRWDLNESLKVCHVSWFITPQLCGILPLRTPCSHWSVSKLSRVLIKSVQFVCMHKAVSELLDEFLRTLMLENFTNNVYLSSHLDQRVVMTTLHCDLCAFLHVSQPQLARYLPEWIMFKTKFVEKNQYTFLTSTYFVLHDG
jgi:hypothetical protein